MTISVIFIKILNHLYIFCGSRRIFLHHKWNFSFAARLTPSPSLKGMQT